MVKSPTPRRNPERTPVVPKEVTAAAFARSSDAATANPRSATIRNAPRDRPDEHEGWLAVVHWRDAAGDWSNLNDDLVENGLAAATRPGDAETCGT
jgi:hypothetical protein